MKTKSKIFTAVLLSCALIMTFTGCSGCVDMDSVGDTISSIGESIGSTVESIAGSINFDNVQSGSSSTTTTTTKDMSQIETEIEQYIYTFTNEERVKNGLNTLTYDAKLSAVSKAHSVDMVTNKYYSHTNLKGQDPTARAKAAGYNTYKSLSGGWYTDGISENIFEMPTGNVRGIGYLGKYDSEKIAREMVDGWMESSGHRANILESGITNMGIGVKYRDNGYYYATQNFW